MAQIKEESGHEEKIHRQTDRHYYSKVFYRLVALCAFAAMLCGGSAWAADYVLDGTTGNEWTNLPASLADNDTLTIEAGAGSPSAATEIKISGTPVTITGPGNATQLTNIHITSSVATTLTIEDLNISAPTGNDMTESKPAIALLSGSTLIVEGTNTLNRDAKVAGIHVPDPNTLTIEGTGTLLITANAASGTYAGGAGIGGNGGGLANGIEGEDGKPGEAAGTITIQGTAAIEAHGGAVNDAPYNGGAGAGIGGGGGGGSASGQLGDKGGDGGGGGTFIINGGSVKAYIGGGEAGQCQGGSGPGSRGAGVGVTINGGSIDGTIDGTITVAATVQPVVSPTAPSIVSGNTVTFTASFAVSGATWQWQKGGVNIPGAASATYTTPVLTTADDGSEYKVIATYQSQQHTSAAATVTVTGTAPSFTQTPVISPDATFGVNYGTETFTFAASGTPDPALSMDQIADANKLGMTISFDPATGVLTISGTPTNSGTVTGKITATNSVGSAETDFTLTVKGTSPSFTQTPVISPDATFGVAYGTRTFTFEVSGNPDPVLSMEQIDEADKLGMTISFAPDTGELTISGTPTNSGTVTGTITADNGITPAATTDFTLTVKGTSPSFTSPPLNIQDVTFGEDYGTQTFTFEVNGNPTPALSMGQIDEAAKLGLTITFDPGTGVLTIEGTPTDSGTVTGKITAENSVGKVTQDFTITVKGTSPSITQTPASIPDATVSEDYGTQTFTFTASGNPAPTLSMDQIDDADKLGLTITFDPVSGDLTISGTPTDSGTVTGRITATNSVDSVSKDFTLTVRGIAPGITQTPASIPDATVSEDYGTQTFTFTASGHPAPTLSMDQIDEKLGLTIDFVDASGVLTISGTPTASGTVTGTVVATNSVGPATKTWTLAVLPDPTPDTPLDDAKDSFNNNNPNSGLTVDFPTGTINDTLEVRSQLDGLTPVILGNANVSSVTLALSDASSQSAADELTSLGKGWGAKIEVELRVAPVAGEILLLPVALTFVLTEADLAEVGLTADGAAGDPASLLAASLFAKFPIEGADKDTLQDFTNLLDGILTVTKTADGGVSIGFSFLLANGAGTPRIVVDGGNRHLVIFDGESNGWLRDPIFIFRRTIVPVEIALTPTPDPLELEEGETGTIAATFTPADTTERDLVWTVDPADIAKVAKAASADTWTVTAITAGSATLTATADGGATATLPLTVTESHESGGGVGCDAGFGALLLLTLGLAAIRRQRR